MEATGKRNLCSLTNLAGLPYSWASRLGAVMNQCMALVVGAASLWGVVVHCVIDYGKWGKGWGVRRSVVGGGFCSGEGCLVFMALFLPGGLGLIGWKRCTPRGWKNFSLAPPPPSPSFVGGNQIISQDD